MGLGRAVRALLLVLVAFGLAYMHTFGHSGQHGATTDEQANGATHRETAAPGAARIKAMLGAELGMTVAIGGFALAPATLTPPPDLAAPGRPMRADPFAVCLAVLSAGLLVLVSALLRGSRRLPPLRGHVQAVLVGAERGPPPSRVGLRLTHLSVIRR